MKKSVYLITLLVLFIAFITGCGTSETEVTTIADSMSTPTPPPPPSAPIPEGETITVTSTDDSGPGSLRQALESAQPGDTIIFDPAVFPPDAPASIFVTSEFSHIYASNLTIDASNAGVILDGIQVTGRWVPGLQIVSAEEITVMGLQITHFTRGIAISGNSKNNIIGGDRSVGDGPWGQGNLFVNNGIGIEIATSNTTLNTVKGNLIGTDGSQNEDLKNFKGGILIWAGAHDNTIGPDNTIANNKGVGIDILGSDTVRNTITQNSIYNNSGMAIFINWGIRHNFRVPVPVILEFDLQDGKMTGTACAECSVEIFSDNENEGAVYEGMTSADGSGFFTFAKGTPFTGPNLTATATDTEGNTSQFSPIAGIDRYLNLQVGNDLPRDPLAIKESRELANNRIGLNWGNVLGAEKFWEPTVEQFNAWGIKRVHLGFHEKESPIDWSTGSELVIPPGLDLYVDGLNEIGVEMDLQLHFYDKEGHSNGEHIANPRFQTQEEIDDFVEFVRTVVRHFKGRIPYYTIWSEPDNCGPDSLKCILPEDYIELARQVIPVIREEDPDAKIVSGPNVLFFDRDDLFMLLRSDVVSMFDVISWHPFYNAAPNVEFFGNYYYEYPSIIQEIKDTASANGFTGEYWGTDMVWDSEEICKIISGECRGQFQEWSIQETDLQAAKYYARLIILELGMDVAAGVEGMMQNRPWALPTVRNLNTVMAGAKTIDLAVDVQNSVRFTLQSTFSMPDGGYLIGLWTNGIAVDNDPGVESTVTIPGVSASKVLGIDVIHGFEQELLFEIVNGNLIINDLLVKDYPIILRITP